MAPPQPQDRGASRHDRSADPELDELFELLDAADAPPAEAVGAADEGEGAAAEPSAPDSEKNLAGQGTGAPDSPSDIGEAPAPDSGGAPFPDLAGEPWYGLSDQDLESAAGVARPEDPMRGHRRAVGVMMGLVGVTLGVTSLLVGIVLALVGSFFGSEDVGVALGLGSGGVGIWITWLLIRSAIRLARDGSQGRVAGYVLGILLCLGFPILTPAGVYALWVLRRTAPARPPAPLPTGAEDRF